ncbi:MAG: hypothetical protein SPG34_01765 [Trueperella sp.]|uniref:hypothetical protein n=1 Tax=Trueperella sp. TaxID=2699835 RepID=UPI002A92055B|nr:hypothetical protein [Trueperella sp.]MDY5403054.1 hypothetical protein [Trueperella sp.]
MFGRSKLPRYLADETGMPAAATPIEPTGEGTWIGGWDGYLAVIPAEGERSTYMWSDFETGTWDDDANTLTLTFVDPRTPSLSFVIPREADGLAIMMIRERIERSIVYTQVSELPSGAIARGQVRRNPDDSLFTQIIVDSDITEGDRLALDALDHELREAVGID